jgi:hypothetical protein
MKTLEQEQKDETTAAPKPLSGSLDEDKKKTIHVVIGVSEDKSRTETQPIHDGRNRQKYLVSSTV